MALKSELSKLLTAEELGHPDPTLDHAAFPMRINVQFGQANKVGRT